MKIRIQIYRLALVVASIVFATGCVSVGRSFNYENVPTLEIGCLKSGEYKSLFGKPLSVQTTSNSDGRFEHIKYLYAHGNLDVVMGRGLNLEFRNGTLNGWSYVSNFYEDRTAIDLSMVGKIQKGVVSRNPRNFRHPNSNPATSVSKSIILPSFWNV